MIWKKILCSYTFFFICVMTVYGQEGKEGLVNATAQVVKYFSYGIDLMYAIGALCGLVGAIKVYSKWSSGDQDTGRVATAWLGSCIFLVVVATVLKGFFNIA